MTVDSPPSVEGSERKFTEYSLEVWKSGTNSSAAVASGADAVVVVTFDQINALLPEMLIQGIDPANVYLVDGNANSFADVVDLGSVTGMQGSIPGAQANDAFKKQLEGIYEVEFSGTLESFTYGPEAYDLVNIVALAAQKAGATDSASIQAELAAVTGANGGEECNTFADCKALLDDGGDIRYVGMSGTGPLNSDNDPSTAWIGIYKYDDTNTPQFVSAVEGEV